MGRKVTRDDTGVSIQLSRSLARMLAQGSRPSLPHLQQGKMQILDAPKGGIGWSKTNLCLAWVVKATYICHTQMFWLSLCWEFSVYYFRVSRQGHFCRMVMGCQVRLLPMWSEETSADGRCHFLGSDVHTHHWQLMPLCWPWRATESSENWLSRQEGSSFSGLIGHGKPYHHQDYFQVDREGTP